MSETIYKVTTEGDVEGKSTKILGYATGEPNHIIAYFDDRKTYDIQLDKIKVWNITDQSANERQSVINSIQQKEREIELLKEKING